MTYWHGCSRSDTSIAESKLKEAQISQDNLTAEAKRNETKQDELCEKMKTHDAEVNDLEQRKKDLAAQNGFLKDFHTLVSRLCGKTEVELPVCINKCPLCTGAVRNG